MSTQKWGPVLLETCVGSAGDVYHCLLSGKRSHASIHPPTYQAERYQEIILRSHAKPVTRKQEVKALYTDTKTKKILAS